MDKKFKQIYYSDGGYWRGKIAIQRLAKASGSTKEEAEKWLLKQPLYQIYLPAPKYIPRPNASMSLFAKPNDIHQSDLLSLPHDKFKKKTYKYALNIVDVASRYKGSYQLTSKYPKEVAQAFQWIYENTPLTYPKTLTVNDGKEFYGDTMKLMEKYDVIIQRGDPSQHHSQGIVERFNRTLADILFTKEVAQAFQWIYENTPLTYPKTLIVDDGKEFYGDTMKLMEKYDVIIQRGDPSQHHSQGIVKRFNRTLADILFTYQYHKEFKDPSKSNREWVSRLQNVVSALNNEKTRLIGMKPVDAIKQTLVEQ